MKIEFGLDWGNCLVTIGSTRVFAQVSCEICQPNNSRPNEGILQISAELAGDNKLTDLTKINQVLERFYKDSKCVDLEALCIIAEEKVWFLHFSSITNIICISVHLQLCLWINIGMEN